MQASFKPSGDYDGFFVDNGASLRVHAITDDTYTSRVAYLDTSESTNGRYYPGKSSGNVKGSAHVVVKHRTYLPAADVTSATTGGESLALVDSQGVGIGPLRECVVDSEGCGTGLRLEASNGGFVNTPIQVSIAECHHLVRHTGSSNARSQLRGTLEMTGACQFGIRNDAGSNESVTFEGDFWDPTAAGTNSLAGERIKVRMTNTGAISDVQGTSDGSFGQFVTRMPPQSSREYLNAQNNTVTKDYQGVGMDINVNGSLVMKMTGSGYGWPQSFDLSGTNGSFPGEVRLDNGSNTTSGNPEPCMWQDSTGDGSGDQWVSLVDGSSFT
ncbi:hypothetical protein BRC81_00190 [Halobacteriales archaeon QS_1_68_20]|nr:MAG: hypothetical protein BRC81_00190 [Halobacteriales archaeon QS_1_68_20]